MLDTSTAAERPLRSIPYTVDVTAFAARLHCHSNTIRKRHKGAAMLMPVGHTHALMWRESYVDAVCRTSGTPCTHPFSTADAAEILGVSREHLDRYLGGLGIGTNGSPKHYSHSDLLAGARKIGKLSLTTICRLIPCTMGQAYIMITQSGDLPPSLEATAWLWGTDALDYIERYQRAPQASEYREELEEAAETEPYGLARWLAGLKDAKLQAGYLAEERREARAEAEASRVPLRKARQHNLKVWAELAEINAEARTLCLRDDLASLERMAEIDKRRDEINADWPIGESVPRDRVNAWWSEQKATS